MEQMKAAVIHDIGDMKVEKVDVPQIKADEVLIKTKVCGICGTDVSMFRGRYLPVRPVIPGHEFSGEIVKAGESVGTIKVGDRVTVDENVSCGVCYFCKRQQKLLCPNLYQVGIHSNGAFAEYVKAPVQNVFKLPREMSYEYAAFTEPLACSIRAVDRAGIVTGDSVVVMGDGPIGLALVQVARLDGATMVIDCGHHEYRLKKALEVGADVAVNTAREDPVKKVTELTAGRGADVVIEAVGRLETYQQAFQMVRRGGNLAIMGVPAAGLKMELRPFDDMFNKELTLHGSFAGTYDTWIRAISLISTGKFKVGPLLTHKSALDQIPSALILMEKRENGAIKILTSPEYKGLSKME